MSTECEQGVVTATREGYATIRSTRGEMCSHCSTRDVCAALESESKSVEIEVIDPVGADVGDHVQLAMDRGTIMTASFLIYMIPVFAVLLGALSGPYIAEILKMDSNLVSIISALAFFIASLSITVPLCNSLSHKSKYVPKITRIVYREGKPTETEKDERSD